MNNNTPLIVNNDNWLVERKKLLMREKELMQLHDQVARERRALPWLRVDKSYEFEATNGPCLLADLFEGRSQLLVQHFMFSPNAEQGCSRCSFMADHVDGMTAHLAQRDTTFVAISRAPLVTIERFRQRMDWQFQWVSSHDNDFNFDFGVSFTAEEKAKNEVTYNYSKQPFRSEELPGVSVFFKNENGDIFHTYSTYMRGVEVMMGTYNLLDLTPKGRDEMPGQGMQWVRHHDNYSAN